MQATAAVTVSGYRNLPTAPAAMPSEAITNENSPICAIVKPVRSASRALRPAHMNAPTLHASVLPTITAKANPSAGHNHGSICVGSSSNPIATKKIAANMSRTGRTSRTMRSEQRAGATTTPARNAPSATLKPSQTASRQAPKQMPSAVTSSGSSRPRFASQSSSRGNNKRPSTSAAATNNNIRHNTENAMSVVSAPPAAIALSTVISTTVSTSSDTSIPIMPVKNG